MNVDFRIGKIREKLLVLLLVVTFLCFVFVMHDKWHFYQEARVCLILSYCIYLLKNSGLYAH